MKRSILLIEDNAQNRYLVTFLLEKDGYEVLSVEDGASGIEAARQRVPDLIVLDIQLPKMNGYEVARRLRHDERLRAVPIVAVTSYATPGDREKAMASGCTGYIEKPIEPETFAHAIRQIIATGAEGAT